MANVLTILTSLDTESSVSGLSVNGPTRTSRRGQSRNTRTSRQSGTDTRIIEALSKANVCPVDEVIISLFLVCSWQVKYKQFSPEI